MSVLTWSRLCSLCPRLQQYQADAASIARWEKWSWYPRWIKTCVRLTMDIRQVCEWQQWDFQQTHELVVGHLTDCYREEKYRLQRQREREAARAAT